MEKQNEELLVKNKLKNNYDKLPTDSSIKYNNQVAVTTLQLLSSQNSHSNCFRALFIFQLFNVP